MDESSFISSFSDLRRVPRAAMLAVALFVGLELAVALLWRPDVVGEPLYGRYSPSYDYGYAPDVPRLFAAGPDWRFYPTEYVNIRPFSLRRSKPANEIRIFVLGGSVSRGSGLGGGVEYASRLEHYLDEEIPAYDWKVINLSADGYGTTRMLHILVHMLRHRPDAIIFHPHGSNEYEDERDRLDRDTLRSGVNGLLLRSHLIVLLKKIEQHLLHTRDQLPADREDEDAASAHPENTARWQSVYERNIAAVRCISEQLRIPVFFVGRAERDAPEFRNDHVEQLNGPIRDAPLYLDAAAALARAAAEVPAAGLWRDNTHYSKAGHVVVARELLTIVRSELPRFEHMMASRRAGGSDAGKIAARKAARVSACEPSREAELTTAQPARCCGE